MNRNEKPVKLTLLNRYADKYRKGWPLLMRDAVANPEALKREGQLIRLYDERNRFIASGYYGHQNKGLGWLLSWEETAVIDDTFFRNCLVKAIGARKGLYESAETNAFRVFNGEGDGIGGLTIDYYDGYYVFTFYSQGIYSFKETLLRVFAQVAGYVGLYQKKRFDAAGKYIVEDDFLGGRPAPEPLVVLENGIRYATYLNDGAMTGIFLDQRQVRRAIRDTYAKGRTVLNTFSYTGAFSVAAALGGALTTTSVDLANRSLPKTREQFTLNGVDPDSQEILVEDVFGFFKYAHRKGLRYGLVILDPPSYATSKDVTFAAERDYVGLLQEAIAITEAGGLIVASTNCSSFDRTKFNGFIRQAFEAVGIAFEILQEAGLPEDYKTLKTYPEGNYLKVAVIRRGQDPAAD